MNLRHVLLVVILTPALSASALAADKNKKGDRKQVDPQLSAQLAKLFDQLDRDKDGSIDKTELAKAFRGNRAGPAPDLFPKTEGEKKPARPSINPNQYPDAVFLAAYDDDDDDRISYAEFEEAGADYAESAKKAAAEIKKAQEAALKQLTSGRRPTGGARRSAGRGSFGNLMNQYGPKR